MYKKFFGLKENPFNVNPDPRYLFLTPYTQEALACLTYGIETRKGFILLTGEVGTGKTTLINKLLEWLHKERVCTAFVFNPRLSVPQFFDFMMADFGIPCDSHQKGQMLQKLNQWLLERYQAGAERKCLNDALAFLQGRKIGYPVVTANVRDFDYLNQLVPDGRILLYRTATG